MTQWRTARLEEVAEVFGGGTPSRTDASYFGGDIAWATPTDVTSLNEFYISATKEAVTEAGLKNSSTKLLPAGAVLLTSRATIGFTAVSTIPICTNQGFINFVCGADLQPEFLAYWLRTQRGKMLQHAGGTTFKEIARGTLRKFEIAFPSLAEQRRIVDRLSRAEAIVRLRREAQRKAAELIPAIFLDLFGDPAANPKSWPVEPFENVIRFTRYGPRFPNREYSDKLQGGRILRTTDIQSDGTIVADEAPMLPMTDDELQKYTLEPNTIVITRTGATIGKVALYENSKEPAVAGAYLIEIRLTERVVAPYVLHLLLGAYGQQRLTSGSRAVAQPNINVPTIAAIPVPLPPLDLQCQFAAKAEAVRSLVARQTAALATAQTAFDALLHRAFADPQGAGA